MIYRRDMSKAPIRVAVLGMLAFRPMTGYEIKKAYEQGPANFMPISFGQIYPVLAKLRQDKMVRQEKQRSGRGNIRYFVTAEGVAAFREWLFSFGEPSDHRELLLRLFFVSPAELSRLREHIEAYCRQEHAALDRYEQTRKWLEDIHGRNPHLPIWKLVMEYGVLESQYRVRWCGLALQLTKGKRNQK